MILSSSAMAAVRALRISEDRLDQVQQRVATGLKVASTNDNPAFFLVSTTTRSDIEVISGVRENLNYAVGALETARAAMNPLIDIIDNVTAAVVQLETGAATEALGRVITGQADIAREIIRNTSYNGLNLLELNQVETFVAGYTRSFGGSLELPVIELQGIGLGVDFEVRNGFQDGSFEDASGAWVLGGGAVQLTNSLSFGSLPFDGSTYVRFGAGNLPGGQASQTFATTPGVEYALTFEYGANATPLSLQTMNVTVDGDTRVLDETISDVGTIPVSYTTGSYTFVADSATTTITFADVSASSTNTDAAIDAVTITALGTGLSEDRFSAASLIQLLEIANPASNENFTTETAFRALNAARARLNNGFSKLGSAQSLVERRQEFLAGLTDSLEQGVAALVEADLAEESSRLAAARVQRELAAQGLSTVSARPNNLLQLFR